MPIIKLLELLIESIKKLVSIDNVDEMMDFAVELAIEISGCSRAVLITKENGGFLIKTGIPRDKHGIGEKITVRSGEEFLNHVMENKKIVSIPHPADDRRTEYVGDLIKSYGVSSILYIPLYYKNINIGILVIDAVGEGQKHLLHSNIRPIKDFFKIWALIVGRELEREIEEKEMIETIRSMENLFALGKHTAGIAHTFRNKLHIIGGFAQSTIGMLSDDPGLISNQDKGNQIKKHMKIIFKEVMRLEKFVSETMTFSKIQDCLKPEKDNINNFLRNEIKIVRSSFDVGIMVELDKNLDRTTAFFDRRFFAIAIQDIVKNAVDAHAKKILIKSHLDSEAKTFQIVVANDGEPIKSEELKEIFSPFFTTKVDGTGLGLANAYAVVTAPAHGGQIEVVSGCASQENHDKRPRFTTWFKISIPFKKNHANNSCPAS